MVEGVVLEEVRVFLKSRVILTAAELDLFTHLDAEPATADILAERLQCDQRALTRILDCLVTFRFLEKENGTYRPTERGTLLSSDHPQTELPMVLHLNGLWGTWSGLTDTVRTGENPKRKSVSERGKDSLNAFIGAMHVVGRTLSREIATDYDVSSCKKLLDLGGGSGTYTIAFLEKNPDMTSVLFDLPDVIPIAEERFGEDIDGDGTGDACDAPAFVPDTGQTKCYDGVNEITCPQPGEPWYGQDAQYSASPRSYTKLDEGGNDLPESATDFALFGDDTDTIDVATGMLSDTEGVYALQVKGQSMIDALINDGDIVVMKHQLRAENGDMVAAWLKE